MIRKLTGTLEPKSILYLVLLVFPIALGVVIYGPPASEDDIVLALALPLATFLILSHAYVHIFDVLLTALVAHLERTLASVPRTTRGIQDVHTAGQGSSFVARVLTRSLAVGFALIFGASIVAVSDKLFSFFAINWFDLTVLGPWHILGNLGLAIFGCSLISILYIANRVVRLAASANLEARVLRDTLADLEVKMHLAVSREHLAAG